MTLSNKDKTPPAAHPATRTTGPSQPSKPPREPRGLDDTLDAIEVVPLKVARAARPSKPTTSAATQQTLAPKPPATTQRPATPSKPTTPAPKPPATPAAPPPPSAPAPDVTPPSTLNPWSPPSKPIAIGEPVVSTTSDPLAQSPAPSTLAAERDATASSPHARPTAKSATPGPPTTGSPTAATASLAAPAQEASRKPSKDQTARKNQPAVKPRRRRHDLDLLRIFAAMMVVVVHANEFLATDPRTRDWLFMDIWSASQRASLPLFFMISGAILLSRPQLDRRRLVRHNVFKMLILFAFWSAFYAAYKVHFHQDYSPYSIALQLLRDYGHLWFLPAMAVCYLCLPPIHAALHNGRQGAIWMVGLFVGVVLLPNALELVPVDGQTWQQVVSRFAPQQAGYVGYMVLGYWLNRWRYGASTLLLAPLGFIAATAASAGGTYWYSLNISNEPVEWLFGPFSPTSALQAVALFCLFLTLRNWHPHRGTAWVLGELSACTLGLYLLHPFFLALLKNRGVQSLNAGAFVTTHTGIGSQWIPVIGAPTLALTVAFVCLVVSFIGRRVPLLKQVI
ncbi:acyltransferase [Actinomyces trachealis]|uniref:acyltransferase n=1 Tax=Actinomyces trachealis TaxID=2763540 RepID=UPI0018C82C40|nr:acyltransferase [Actinomyces trachealis]